MKLVNNQSDSEIIKAKNVKGLKVIITGVSDTNDQYATPNLSNVNMSIKYSYLGNQKSIYDGNLLPLAIHATLMNPRVQMVHPLQNQSITTTAKGASVKGIQFKAFDIYFGSPVACGAGSELYYESRVGQLFTAGSPNYGDTSSSNILIEPIFTDEPMIGIPKITVLSVQGSEQSKTYSIGDGVQFSTFVNIDNTSVEPCISSLSFQSDTLNDTFSYPQLVDLTLSKLSRGQYDLFDPTGYKLGNCHLLLANEARLMNNVSYSVAFNSDNIASGKNFFVTTSIELIPELVARAKMWL